MLIAAGIAAGLLYLAGAVALGTPPRAEDNGAQVVAWVNAHGDGVRWYVWTLTISVPFFAVMFALLRGLLPAPHRDVFWAPSPSSRPAPFKHGRGEASRCTPAGSSPARRARCSTSRSSGGRC